MIATTKFHLCMYTNQLTKVTLSVYAQKKINIIYQKQELNMKVLLATLAALLWSLLLHVFPLRTRFSFNLFPLNPYLAQI